MTSPVTVQVQVTRRFSASAERVFDAWLDAACAAKWLFATPTGEMVRAEIDPRVGGTFVLTERRDGVDTLHTGEYLEIDRPRRLVFTFGVPQYAPDFTPVTVEIAPLDSGCELTLTNDGIPEAYAAPTRGGWTKILDGLAAMLD
jgi:uncharacterized protein YndB with AHSA1/START domain